jgi:apyrase/ectonucleoside triphosphate diphosphohydrolase 5/6
MPSSFFGFSYMYDRTGAIGLLDTAPAQFGSLNLSADQIEDKAKEICALDGSATRARFAAAGDASKSVNFCGDILYVSVLLEKLGFDEHKGMTMTNKIKDVELVWTLGAMLAKSAELTGAGDGDGGREGRSGSHNYSLVFLLLAVSALLFRVCLSNAAPTPKYERASGFPP